MSRSLVLAAETYNAALYATLAQVLPVLFILLAIELRFFRDPDHEDPLVAAGAIAVFLLLVGGEYVAITSLAEQEDPSRMGVATIGGALGITGVALAVGFLRPHIKLLETKLVYSLGLNVYTLAVVILFALTSIGLISRDVFIGFAVFVPFAVGMGGVTIRHWLRLPALWREERAEMAKREERSDDHRNSP
jgi:hypothetical protein